MIIHAIVDLSVKLGFRTIAEGVETEAQATMLRDCGVDCLQGYYFSRPVPGTQLSAWLTMSETVLVA
jgi:EAL domain-containing protein (putative c-di-GMP-specific phosphodiesterase class I)